MAQYPRLLNLDTASELRLISYLNDELSKHSHEREEPIQQLKDWQKDYWAEPSLETRVFPFQGASNIVIPLTAIAIEAVHARIMTTIFASTPVISVDMRGPQFSAAEHPLENYMDYELKQNLNLRGLLNSSGLEGIKFGTGIGKSDYQKVVKRLIRRNENGEREEIPVLIKDGATLDPVAYHNFVMPHYSQDPQLAPWVGEIMSKTPFEIMNLESSGLFEKGTFDALKGHFSVLRRVGENDEREFTVQQEDLEKAEAVFPDLIDFYLLHLSFDVDGVDSLLEEIVVWYHWPSSTIMAARYNWNEDLRRPYRIVQYVPVEHRWRGIGICKQNSQFQKEVTTIHRQRLDNATVANMRMFVVNKLAHYGPKEPIFPGKMWFVDDLEHIKTLQTGDVYPSSYANEQSAVIFAQQRSGVNDVTLGMPQVGTPGTATGDLARIQEGNKKFDYSMDNYREWIGILTMDGFLNIKQFGPRHANYFAFAEGGQEVLKILALDIQTLRSGIVFGLKASGQQQNRLLDRNNWQQIAALVNQYYVAMIQLAMQAQRNDLVSIILNKGMLAATETMKQILEYFDVRSINRILVPEIEELLGISNGNGNGQNPQSAGTLNGGADPGAADLANAERLAAIQSVLGRIGSRSGETITGL